MKNWQERFYLNYVDCLNSPTPIGHFKYTIYKGGKYNEIKFDLFWDYNKGNRKI